MMGMGKPIIVAIFIFAGASSVAHAQICTTTCSRYEEGECVEHMQMCNKETARPAPSYGAIAYGRTSGAYGFSHGWSSQKKAESVALQNCAQHGSDCESMVWFDRKCGAVTARSDSTAAYWGLGNGAGDANAEAMRQCTKDKGQHCTVKVTHCSR
jgi:hypothetical protein